MNERIQELADEAGNHADNKRGCWIRDGMWLHEYNQKFAELIISAVLDEVNERAYYSGDRAWSDDLDRKWIELEFGFGELAKIKNGNAP